MFYRHVCNTGGVGTLAPLFLADEGSVGMDPKGKGLLELGPVILNLAGRRRHLAIQIDQSL